VFLCTMTHNIIRYNMLWLWPHVLYTFNTCMVITVHTVHCMYVCMYVLFIQLGVSCVDTKVVEVRMNVVIYVLVYHGMCMFTVRSSS
jgi:hypothetical protein